MERPKYRAPSRFDKPALSALRLPPDVAPPNFFILGAAKSGTTSLYRLLGAHPSVYFPLEKEPRFFADETYYAMGLTQYLLDHFRGSSAYPARGEATPTYLSDGPAVRDRILRDLGGDLRFIVILRDPVERAWSHYQNQVRIRAEAESFERALTLEAPRRRKKGMAWSDYFSDGLYARHLRTWFEAFDPERFVVFLTRDLAADSSAVVRRALEHLDLDPEIEIPPGTVWNRRSEARVGWLARVLNRPGFVMRTARHLVPYATRQQIRNRFNRWNRKPASTRERLNRRTAEELRRRYLEDIADLEGLLRRDLSFWSEPARRPPG